MTRASSNSGVVNTPNKLQLFGLEFLLHKNVLTLTTLIMKGSNMGVTTTRLLLSYFLFNFFFKWLTVPAHGTSGREKAELSFILGHTDIKPAQLKRPELEFIQRFD